MNSAQPSNHIHLLVSDNGTENTKDERWSESVTVGSEAFIMNTMEKLGIKAKGREAIEADGRYQFKEPKIFYKSNFNLENGGLRLKIHIFGIILFEYQ